MSCQPSKIFVFIASSSSVTFCSSSRLFLTLVVCPVYSNDKSALLSSMDESSLYEMSAFNVAGQRGSFMPWSQWKYGCGTIICIDVPRDLSVAEGSQAGSQNNFSTLQITLTYSNSNVVRDGAGASAGAVGAAGCNAYQVVVL